MKNPPQVILRRIFLLVTCDRGWVGLKLSFSRRRVAEGWFVPSFLSDTPGPTVCATGHRGGLFRGTTRLAHPVRVCETSCFAEFIVRQNARHPASRFAFLLIAHPWALRLFADSSQHKAMGLSFPGMQATSAQAPTLCATGQRGCLIRVAQ